MENVIAEIMQELEDSGLSKEKKARMIFDYKKCIQNVSPWKAHLLCSVNQEDEKQDTLDKFNKGIRLIVIDRAVKFLPHHYHEQMSEFFSIMVEVGMLVL